MPKITCDFERADIYRREIKIDGDSITASALLEKLLGKVFVYPEWRPKVFRVVESSALDDNAIIRANEHVSIDIFDRPGNTTID